MRSQNNKLKFFIKLLLYAIIVVYGGLCPVMASEQKGTGLNFPVLLDESIKAKGSLNNGLLLITRECTWDTMPQNHEEMIQCVDKESQWNPDRSGISMVGSITNNNNRFGFDDYYTSLYTGYFYAETAGTWKFATNSDDASEVVIDGRVVADWYGEHGTGSAFEDHSGTIELAEGWHHIVYRFVEKTGNQCADPRFRAPNGIGWKTISTRYLTLKAYPDDEGLLLVTKKNKYDEHPVDHDELENCIDVAADSHIDYFGWSVVNIVDHTENIHGNDDTYTSLYTTYFEVTEEFAGEWQFATNSGSASEIEINGQVITSWYGDHEPAVDDWSHSGVITLAAGWHQFIYRHETSSGNTPAAKAFFQAPSDTDWRSVSTAEMNLRTYAADLDDDGLHNDLEGILGTDMENPDTDFEGLTDFAEAMLDTDPLSPDSNNDGLPDSTEIMETDWDPDGDGENNLWDDDNDDDGVKDGLDSSPFARSEFNSEFHFEISTNGKPTYLDFQIRPKDPMNLMLLGKQWDWPLDEKGQMQDRDDTKEDVQLIPMLELTTNILPDQDHVEENGIYVTEDNRMRALDGNFTHDDGMDAGNVLGDSEKEVVVAWDKDHKITVKDLSGKTLQQFECVFSTGDRFAVADVLGNSYAEILVFHGTGTVGGELYVYTGEGHLVGNFDIGYRQDAALAVGDIRKDNKAEILIGYQESGHIHSIHFYQERKKWKIGSQVIDETSGGESYALGVADVDGDSKCEVLRAWYVADDLDIYEYYYDDTSGLWYDRVVNRIGDFKFDKYDGLIGAEVLPSSDPDNPRYGEEIICLKPNGNAIIYTEQSSGKEDELEDLGYSEFDGYTSSDIMGDELKEIIVTSDTAGVVKVYNPNYSKAYVPLSPVQDTGSPVAFQGRMIYSATGGPITLVADVRLVWFVTGKTDSEDEPDKNETIVLAKYQEDFQITGFSATEHRGITAGIFHKDDRDEVSNAYTVLQNDFLYDEYHLSDAPSRFSDLNVDVENNLEEFDHEYEADKWIGDTLADDILPGLLEDKYPVVFGKEFTCAHVGMDLFIENGVVTGSNFTADLADKPDQVEKSIKMNWYDTGIDTVSPLTIDAIAEALKSWGYTEQEIDIALPNIMIASEGEEGPGDKYSPLKRKGIGLLVKGGSFAANAFFSVKTGNNLVKATRLWFAYKVFDVPGYKCFKIKWAKAYKLSTAGGFCGKLGRFKLIRGLKTYGGAAMGIAFAVYTFYQVSDASGWSNAGMAAGGLYAGMQGSYFMVCALISNLVPGGPLITGLIMISDVITWAITGEGWTDRIMSWVVEKLTEIKNPPKVDLDISDTTVIVTDYEENGLDVGDRIEFKCRATEYIKKDKNTWSSDVRDSYLKPYAQFQDSSHYKDSSYRHQISNYLNDDRRERVWEFGAWVEPNASDTDFKAKVRLTAKMKIYYRVCTAGECDRKSKYKEFSYGNTTLYFDVMPGSLEAFLKWPVITPLDKDNDGLDNDKEKESGTWYTLVNKGSSDDTDQTQLLNSCANTACIDTTTENTRWRFELQTTGDNDGYYAIRCYKDLQSYVYLTAYTYNDENDLYRTKSILNDSLWDIVPVVDDLVVFINKSKSDTEGEPYCLKADASEADYAKTCPCKDGGDYVLWQIETDQTKTKANASDTDGDGVSDYYETNFIGQGQAMDPRDADSDNDGLRDRDELLAGTNPMKPDTDNDGIHDIDEISGWQVNLTYNTLNVVKTVYSSPVKEDSDGDGLSDMEEKNSGPSLNPLSRDTDGDGVPDNRDDDPFNSPEGPDSDYDRLSDETETTGWEITVTTASSGTIVRIATSDPSTEHSDGDAIPDREEYTVSDPKMDDTDEDGLNDKEEKSLGTDVVHFDTDRDGLSDGDERDTYNTNPTIADTDKDGLNDGAEINTYNTDPLIPDTDEDGLTDFAEVDDTGTNPANADSDGDGLDDGAEIEVWETDPLDADSDDDTLSDGQEALTHNTNPNLQDTDKDNVDDASEVNDYCSMATRFDTDRDTLNDYDEIFVYNTMPCSPDTDIDGLNDSDEIAMGTDPNLRDSDGDLIEDGEEVHEHGTDPLSNDTDGDGLLDNIEITSTGTNPTEADTDNDEIPDNLDPDTIPISIDEVLVLYDEAVENMDEFIAALDTLVGTVHSGTLADFPNPGDYPLIVMLGIPDDSATGSVNDMIYQLTDEETRATMLADDRFRFAISAVPGYTGLPEGPGEDPPPPIGPQVDLGLTDSLIVMLTVPYDNDVFRVLYKFMELEKLYWENYVMQTWTSSNPITDPITSFTLDGIENTGTIIEDAQLSTDAGFVSAATAAYTDDTSSQQLREANGLLIGDVVIDKYFLLEAGAIDTNVPPQTPQPISGPISSATIKTYYTIWDLDRSLPRDGDCVDIGDIDETTLGLYWWNGSSSQWEKVTTDLTWVSDMTIDTANVEINGTTYEGFIEIDVSRFGLFCLSGEKYPDTTPDGPPYVSLVSPAPDAVGVALNTDIQVTFSEELLAADAFAITIDGAEVSAATLDATNRVITIEHNGLVPNVTYTVTVPMNMAVDAAGNPNDTEYLWSFTAVEPNIIPFAMDDYFSVDENSQLSSVNVMDDNGEGEDWDTEDDLLSFSAVNSSADNIGMPVNGSAGGVFVIQSDGSLTFDPNGEFEDLGIGEVIETTITYDLTDGNGTDSATVLVTVNGVNDQPVMSTDTRNLNPVDEDAGDDDGDDSDGDDDTLDNNNNYGTTVAEMLGSAGEISDVDANGSGIAIIGVDHQNGSWQYSLDRSVWITIDPTVAADNGVLLDETGWLRFVPATGYNGTLTGNMMFKAWDISTGSSGETGVDTTEGTPFSNAQAYAVVTVTPVNDAPVLAVNDNAIIDPEETVLITNAELNAEDFDDTSTGLTYTITSAVSHGDLFIDANSDGSADPAEIILAGDTFTQNDIDSNLLHYTNNSGNTATDRFMFDLSDGGEDGAEPLTNQTFTIIIRSNVDDDEDGMPTWWELVHKLDPDVDDADQDPDEDGLCNREEYIKDSDPNAVTIGPGVAVLVLPEHLANDQELTIMLETDYTLSADPTTHHMTCWQIASDAGFTSLVMEITSSELLTDLSVPYGVLDATTIYYWRACYVDVDGAYWNWSSAWSFTTGPLDFADENDNKIPDDQEVPVGTTSDLDGDGNNDPEQAGMKCVSLPDGNGHLAIKAGYNVADIDMLVQIDPEDIEDTDNRPDDIPFGLYNFRLELIQPGESATVTFYFSDPVPEKSTWFKYDSVNGWQDYATHAVISNDRTSVLVELVDGGNGDADGVANGIIVDPSGPSSRPDVPNVATASDDDDSNGGSGGSTCFISTIFSWD